MRLLYDKLVSALFRPVDIASLVIFRVAFGAIMVWEVLRYWDRMPTYVLSPFNFTYYGFEWVKPFPIMWSHVEFVVMGAAGAGIMLGLFYRFSCLVFFFTFGHFFLLEQSKYLNHHYLVCLFSLMLIFLPMHRSWSFDAWAGRVAWSETVPAWPMWLLRGQMAIVYSYAALAKLNVDWLRGQPMIIWLRDDYAHPLIGPIAQQPWAPYFVSYSGLVFDLLVAPALLWRPTRVPAFIATLAFHTTNSQLFSIGIFPWMGIAVTTIFLDPDWPRWLWRKVSALFSGKAAREVAEKKAKSKKKDKAAAEAKPVFEVKYLVVVGVIGWLAFQVLFPLRHFLYPGDVSWTEEGHNFSWHMKLRTKSGDVRLLAVDPVSRESTRIDPRNYLSSRQYRKFAGRPDMILKFAHYIRDRLENEGMKGVEIYAHTSVSLNGRRPQPLIDPEVDLAKVVPSLAPKSWIVPLAEPLFPIEGLSEGDGWTDDWLPGNEQEDFD